MKKYITNSRAWQVAVGYLLFVALFNFFHVKYNFIVHVMTVSPYFSLMTAFDLFVVIFLVFRTKLGYFLTIIYFLWSIWGNVTDLLDARELIEILSVAGGLSTIYPNLAVLVLSLGLKVLLIIFLISNQNSRKELKAVPWATLSFLVQRRHEEYYN